MQLRRTRKQVAALAQQPIAAAAQETDAAAGQACQQQQQTAAKQTPTQAGVRLDDNDTLLDVMAKHP